MHTKTILSLLTSLTLVACISPPRVEPVVEPVVVQPTEPPPQNQEILSMLSQLQEIRQELRQLRNVVEELQFESENAKRRRQDLYEDLDRRLLALERGQSELSPNADAATDLATQDSSAVAVTTDPAIEDQSTAPDDTAALTRTDGAVSLEEQDAYEQAFEMLRQSSYTDAITSFQGFVEAWPDSQLADDAYYWMSEARYVNRDFEQALNGFRTVVSRYPDSQRVPEALLKIGYIQYDIGTYDDAADTFRDILARFPGHQVTISAKTRLRRIEQTIQ